MNPLKLLTPVLFFILLHSNFSYSQTGWFNLNPTPTHYSLHNIQMINSLTGYVNGEASTILKTTDGGLSWFDASLELELFATEHGTYTYPVNTNFINANTGFASGKDFYKTTNGGASWIVYTRQSPFYIPNEFKYLNESVGYTTGQGIRKTSNGGLTWMDITVPVSIGGIPVQLNKSHFLAEGTGIGVSLNGMIIRTTNDGANWVKVLDSNASIVFPSVSFINSQTGFVSGKYGRIYKTTNAGLTWTVINSNLTGAFNIKFVDENVGYSRNFFDDKYPFKKTNDGGLTWENISMNINYLYLSDIYDYYFDGTGVGFITAANGIIYRTSDDGVHWTCVTSKIGFTNYLSSLSFLNESTGYIADVRGYLLKTIDGGNNFTKRKIETDNFFSISFPSENTGYGSADKTLIKTIDGGASWDTVLTEKFNPIGKVTFLNNNTGFVFRNSGFDLMRTSDGGTVWSGVVSGGNIFLSFGPMGTGYYSKVYNINAYNASSAIYKTIDFGASWNFVDSLSDKIIDFSVLSSDVSYAIGKKIYKTINGGADWLITSDKYATSIQFINNNTGYILGENFMRWPTGYKTTDGGATWMEQNFHESIFYFANAQTGYTIGQGGLIRKTITGGMVSIGNNNSLTADRYYLSQNYPNPFNPETKIQFSIPKSGLVKIVVYDLLGREVKQLVNEFKQQGSYNVSFNGVNLSSGIYFYKLITDDFVETKKMILVK